ncbi:MAG TPA: hypothetical protein VHT28_00575 [Silvibacterium sp.]|jgi:hypothetical protein|nr:hypothetical protein [Silvibacterium sp.]
MSILRKSRRAIRKIIFGDTLLPHGVRLGFVEPQTEVAVWLHGMGAPLDVTHRHSMACADPLTVCIAFDKGQSPGEQNLRRLSLRFCEHNGKRRVLGEIFLRPTRSIPVGSKLFLFEARSSRNYCLPRARLWAHDLLRAYTNWRRVDASALKMSLGGMRAMTVMFIRPHPVVLVSHASDAGGNIFPMNLMGDLGNGYFAFALVDSREAAIGVERARRIALSSLPLPHAAVAFQLAPNHFRQSIDWSRLAFATRASATFRIPVPAFAQRVREMEIAHTCKLGSHKFFIARIVSDKNFTRCEVLHLVDGIYQAWRLKDRGTELQAPLAADSLDKRRACTS